MVVPDDKGNIFTGELLSKAVKCLPFFQGKKVMTAASLSGCVSVEFLFANFFLGRPKKKLEGFVWSFLIITGLRSQRQFASKCSFLASRPLGHCSFRIS